jgi:hypothetical protein
MEPWQFFQGPENKWCWRKLDTKGHTLSEGAIWFTSLDDCVAEATSHGFDGDVAESHKFFSKAE